MPVLRLLEHYPSVQGEGPRTGIPTQFVRFAGCNLRCPSWPCDTQFAIEPKLYRREQVPVTVEELVRSAEKMRRGTGARNICLTGGEPLVQSRNLLDELIQALITTGFTVEMFSNGTLHYSDFMINECNIVMDWKLPGSGEEPHDTTRMQNFRIMCTRYRHTVKFTCADMLDLEAAKAIYERYDMKSFNGDIYVGPVWDAELPPKFIVKFVLDHQLPWNLNLQVHKYIWPPDARRT